MRSGAARLRFHRHCRGVRLPGIPRAALTAQIRMLDLSTHPVLDKVALIGACARLPLRCDAERLRAEVAALPASLWGTRGGRVGVHNAAQAIFLRGHAPAEGPRPIEDR